MSLEGWTKFMIVALIYYFNDAQTVLFLTAIFAFIQSWFVFLSPESPKFLYSIGRKKEANESLRYIAKVNGANFKGIDIEKEDDKDEKDGKSNNKSLFEALKDPLYRKNILVMTFVFCVSFMSYYVIGYYIGSFPGNMFINAFAVITSDIIGSGLWTVWLNTFGLKNGFSVMYIIVVFSAIVYYLSSETLMVTYACVFTIRFGLTLAVSISLFAWAQIFETKLQARSFAFWNFAGRIATILSPLIVHLQKIALIFYILLYFLISYEFNLKSII